MIQPRCLASRKRRSTSNAGSTTAHFRSEEHTSELQSQSNLVCRLLLEKKNVLHPPLEAVSWFRRPNAAVVAQLCRYALLLGFVVRLTAADPFLVVAVVCPSVPASCVC